MTSPDRDECKRRYDALVEKLFKGTIQEKTIPDDFDRIYFYLCILHTNGLLKEDSRVMDLGGGLSIFAPLVAQYGVKVTIVDDFGGGGGVLAGERSEDIPMLDEFEKFGIEIREQNFLDNAIEESDGSFDAVVCFHSLEHWHNSPKRLFSDLHRLLRNSGFLILATPNAVNLRKRFYVLFGKTNFPRLAEWYFEEPLFRGHVREPVLGDLQQLLKWNGFEVAASYGRNFIGRRSEALSFLPDFVVGGLAKTGGSIMRFFPRLCSDIHVVGRKDESLPVKADEG